MILCDISNWIQAVAALASLLITLVTLLVLLRYADDTKRIADVSASQTENSQMPFLAVAMRENTREERGGWVIQNQGSGPALNVFYSVYDSLGNRSMRSMPPLGKGALRENLHEIISNGFARGSFEILYESLSGLRYRTTVEMVEGESQIQFHKPNIPTSSNTIRDVIKRFWHSL